jgi:hypothetical protein
VIAGERVIDAHGHVGNWEVLGMRDDPAPVVAAMDLAGIDVAVVFHIFHPDGRRGNDAAAAYVRRHPDRFVALAYASPLMPEGMVAELARAVDELGMRGVKIYPPYTTFPLDHPAWDPIYEFVDERGLPLLAHTDAGDVSQPAQLATSARRFPRASFIAGHSGNVEPARSQSIAAARELPNFYLETCSTYRTPGVIEELVAGAGADRVLFGSDQPLMDPRPQLGKILTANLSDADKGAIIGGNARRLLRL